MEVVTITSTEHLDSYFIQKGSMLSFETDGINRVKELYLFEPILLERDQTLHIAETIKENDFVGFRDGKIVGSSDPTFKVLKCFTIFDRKHVVLNATNEYGNLTIEVI